MASRYATFLHYCEVVLYAERTSNPGTCLQWRPPGFHILSVTHGHHSLKTILEQIRPGIGQPANRLLEVTVLAARLPQAPMEPWTWA